MYAHMKSAAFLGVDALPIEVEADVAPFGRTLIVLVGLPDASVKESGERVSAAIANSGFAPPRGKVIVNLAPADTRKEGPVFDLPIALSILVASGQLSVKWDNVYFIGELALDGQVRPIRGAISAALAAKREGATRIYVPKENATEAAVVDGIEVVGVSSLAESVAIITGARNATPVVGNAADLLNTAKLSVDFSEVRGQTGPKRAIMVAAAGGHNLLFLGPPGSGKTMLARRLPTILPPIEFNEAIESTSIHSLAGALKPGTSLITERPFRSPHHSVSVAALIGGGTNPSPGEVSLAHHGVLFLDELAEFPRPALEALRQPLEDGMVSVSRVGGKVTMPSQFMLVAAANPCPCGYLGDTRRPCKCSSKQVASYRAKLSGPLLDRIDMHVEVRAVPVADMDTGPQKPDSETLRASVTKAREMQKVRFEGTNVTCNARMNSKQLEKACHLDADSKKLIKAAMEQLGLSARAYSRVLKLARTIADIDGSESISKTHLSEAVMYRSLDRTVI